MKKQILKALAVVCMLSMLCMTAFAAPYSSEEAKVAAWLVNPENTQFDYEDTSFVDSLIDWTAFTLTRAGKAAPAEYADYINEAVANAFDKMYPSDLARTVLTVTANGMDAKNIGGHDLLAALAAVDYGSQIYLSSLNAPLLAMHFKADFPFDASLKNEIVEALLAVQQADGGWAYCSVDQGYGVYSDADSTSMTVQALAPYYTENEAVGRAVDKALAYLQAQIGATGALEAWGAPSGESTAQFVLALCELGIDPTDSAYTNNGKTLLDGVKSFVTENGGALNYTGQEDPLTTYQVLLALNAANRCAENRESVFTYVEKTEEPTNPVPTVPSVSENTTADNASQTVDIPKTGSVSAAAGAFVAVLCAGAVLTLRKKDA